MTESLFENPILSLLFFFSQVSEANWLATSESEVMTKLSNMILFDIDHSSSPTALIAAKFWNGLGSSKCSGFGIFLGFQIPLKLGLSIWGAYHLPLNFGFVIKGAFHSPHPGLHLGFSKKNKPTCRKNESWTTGEAIFCTLNFSLRVQKSLTRRKREKVTWEVKECSRRKAQNGQAKNVNRKEQCFYNNCYELRSRAIKNIPGRLPENSHRWFQ